jgi:heme-degrading monooxygenase HmoA
MRTLPRLAALPVLASLVGGCAIATPWRASPAGEAGQAEAGDPAVIVVTEARLGGSRAQRDAFWQGVRAVERDLPNRPGLIGYSLRRELFGDRAWTMSAWESEGHLYGFVFASTHRRAMADGDAALIAMRSVRLDRPREKGPPSWAEALDALDRAGEGYR